MCRTDAGCANHPGDFDREDRRRERRWWRQMMIASRDGRHGNQRERCYLECGDHSRFVSPKIRAAGTAFSSLAPTYCGETDLRLRLLPAPYRPCLASLAGRGNRDRRAVRCAGCGKMHIKSSRLWHDHPFAILLIVS